MQFGVPCGFTFTQGERVHANSKTRATPLHPSWRLALPSAPRSLPSFNEEEAESKATMVDEQAVSMVKHGPRREKTWEMRPDRLNDF